MTEAAGFIIPDQATVAAAVAPVVAAVVPPVAAQPAAPAPAPVPVSQEEQAMKAFMSAMIHEKNPKAAFKAFFDADQDGKMSLSDLRQRRWTLVVLTLGIIIGTLIMEPGWPVWVVVNHWIIMVVAAIAYCGGLLTYWLFKSDIDKVEDAVVEKINLGLEHGVN